MRRSWRPAVVVAISILVVGVVAAGSVQASSPNTVTAVNQFSVQVNKSLNVQLRFAPGTLHIQHGATLTFREGPPIPPFTGPVEPHTLSILRPGQVPTTLRQIFFCPACGPILAAHDPNNDEQPPFVYRINKGGPGLNAPGDSLLVDSTHPVITAKVTAPAGTTLRFICVIHPWMQGKLVVN